MKNRDTNTNLKYFVLLLFLLLGIGPVLGQTAPIASPDPSFFDYDSQTPFAVTTTPADAEYGKGDGISVTRLTYPSPVVTPYLADNTITAYLFMPPGPGPHPAMLILHEWLPKDLDLEASLCHSIAQNGVAALMMVEPFSFDRRPVPRVQDAELLSGDLPQMVSALHQTVLDSRRSLDYLQSRPDIDPNKMGVGGISLGGIMSALVAGVDHRTKVLMTFVGGGDVADVIWSSYLSKGVRESLIQHGYTEADLHKALIPLEPTLRHPAFGPENVLMFNGRIDVIVKPVYAEDLARSFGGAHIVWTNTGHYGLAFSMPEVVSVGGRFLRARFFPGSAPFVAPDTLRSRTIKVGLIFLGHEGINPVFAYQLYNFDRAAQYSIDGQLTLHGLSFALSARTSLSSSIGVEFPVFHGKTRPHPEVLASFTF